MSRRDWLRRLGWVVLGSSATAPTSAGNNGNTNGHNNGNNNGNTTGHTTAHTTGAEPGTGSARTRSGAHGRQRFLVIGAGLAGLAAARALAQQAHEVVVLEARDRIGGRIWTSKAWADCPLDLGASWIHGTRGNPLTGLADAIQARRWVTSYDRAATFHTSGRRLTAPQAARLESINQRMHQALRRAQGMGEDRSVRQAVAELEREYKGTPEAARFLDFCLSGNIEQEYAGSAHQLSAHWYDSAEAFGGDDALLAQGFRVITDHLAQGLDVRLEQTVQEVHWQQPGVRVLTQAAAFEADKLIVTLPLGVLQSGAVRFSPDLPGARRQAIESLGMGVLNKCYLRFERAFWPRDVDWLEYVPARHGEWTEWVSLQRVAQMPVLLGFNAADRGREIEALSDEQTVASAMQTLRTLFGAAVPDPVGHQITRWAADPFARGSYSFNALGSTPEMRNTLASALHRQLFFAGEATSRAHFGTAHGAYLSGLRAAEEALAA